MASTTTWQPSQWADLLPEILGRVIARLPFPDDLARLRAVCRPWHAAVREHACPEVPWIIHSDGTFVTTYDYGFHRRVPFLDNTRFIGATGSWLALYRTDANDGRRSYLLHNPFTMTTLPLPGLDAVIGKVSQRFKIRKVLMRSDQDDIIVVMTNHLDYPIILCRPGKPRAWLPQQPEMQFARISDVAFHKGSLFGIMDDREFVMLALNEDDDGTPNVTCVVCLIKYMPGDDEVDEEDSNEDDGEALGNEYEQESEYSDASSFVEEDEDDEEASNNDDEEDADYNEVPSSLDEVDEEASSVKDEFEEDVAIVNKPNSEDNLFNNNDHEDVSGNEDESDTSNVSYGYENNEAASNISDDYEKYYNGDMSIVIDDEDDECDGDKPHKLRNYTVTTRHLIESDGKLLMLRRQERILHSSESCTFNVEVLEADLDVGEWVPTDVTGTLYVSNHNSQYVSTLSGEEDELTWYFTEDHDMFDSESQTSEEMIRSMSTWFFPQELVVQLVVNI
jgi:hypothetical protein